jgi:hypothetical protein
VPQARATPGDSWSCGRKQESRGLRAWLGSLDGIVTLWLVVLTDRLIDRQARRVGLRWRLVGPAAVLMCCGSGDGAPALPALSSSAFL